MLAGKFLQVLSVLLFGFIVGFGVGHKDAEANKETIAFLREGNDILAKELYQSSQELQRWHWEALHCYGYIQ